MVVPREGSASGGEDGKEKEREYEQNTEGLGVNQDVD